jgi:hypothetical protein
MRQPDRSVRRRAKHARATGWLFVLLCLVTQRPPEISRALERFDATSPPDSTGSLSNLRLGTAARPFAWATATGDLNYDGTPDHAVADRLGRDASGFAYELQVSITGVGSQSVRFDSPESALDVSLLDIDHDDDLDVVVSAVFSPAPARVWLNDGAGRFHEADVRALPRERPSAGSRAGTDDVPDRAGAGPVPRRFAEGLEADAASSAVLVPLDRVNLLRVNRTPASPTSPRRSRSPPSAGRSPLA